MYQLGKRLHRHRRFWHVAVALLVLLIGSFISYRLLHLTVKPASLIHNTPPRSTGYTGDAPSTIHIDKPLLSLDLPKGWQAEQVIGGVNPPTYRFKSPSVQAQQLDIFIDNTPGTLAVNRVVTVSAQGAGLAHENVSDNCSTFTRSSKNDASTGVASGVWQGAGFLCDLGNYQRDVVGIASLDGTNVVALIGPTAGMHKVFMAYTDNNINPDFSVLYSILESFKLK